MRALKDLPTTEQDKVDTFNEKVKPIIEGVKGIQVKVQTNLGTGDMFSVIKDVLPL
jgi:hypothetical protein